MIETLSGVGLSPLEIVVVLSALALVTARWYPARGIPARWRPAHGRRLTTIVSIAAVVVSATVLVVIGVRWQLVPVLAGAAIALPFAVGSALPRRTDGPVRRAPQWLTVLAAVASVGLIVTGPLAAWAFPIPAFPEPSGPYAVGTTVLEWTDPDRPETATPQPDDRRTVVAQLWYPAQPTPAGVPRARYLGRTDREAHQVAGAIADYLGVPGFLLDGVARARTRAVPDAPVATDGGRFPVVLFSPGLGGVRTQNTALAEDLASRGYVVAALDHPYDSSGVVLADGRVIRTLVAATGDQAEDERRAAGWAAVRAADLGFALTQLTRLDRGEIAGPLTGRLDTDRAAATGHSLGGAAALWAAGHDRRFAAIVNLDGAPYDPDPRPYPQPALALTHPVDEADNPTYIPGLTRVLALSTATSYRITVPGSAHLTFTDAPLFLPPVPQVVGSQGRAAALRRTTAVCVAFLDATLRGNGGDLAAELSRYGELTVHRGDAD